MKKGKSKKMINDALVYFFLNFIVTRISPNACTINDKNIPELGLDFGVRAYLFLNGRIGAF
jgi:hypothetical protein